MDADELAAQTEVLADIGLALVQAQLAERIMRQTLLLVLPQRSPNDLKALVEAGEMLEDRMFGQLLNMLRHRADLDDNLAEMLRKFRIDRNNLAHHLDRIPGFDISTPKGRAVLGAGLGDWFLMPGRSSTYSWRSTWHGSVRLGS